MTRLLLLALAWGVLAPGEPVNDPSTTNPVNPRAGTRAPEHQSNLRTPSGDTAPPGAALAAMVDTERAFARRATVVGWKQAFLEYFAESAVGFDGETAGPAREQIRQAPDPAADLQLLWEPRYGGIAASGDMGWLTGPSTTINPARNSGAPRYGNYASVWKRQADGGYKVVMDVGIGTPSEPPFAPGFTGAPQPAGRAGAGTRASAETSLRAADAVLTSAARAGQAHAYRQRLADSARLHRQGVLPLVGKTAALAWLRTQPAYTGGETRFSEASASLDLGYTWGSYALAATPDPAGAPGTAEKGFYARVWMRGRDGAWTVVLDVLQPQ